MSKLKSSLLVFLLLFGLAVPVLGQESTDEPTPTLEVETATPETTPAETDEPTPPVIVVITPTIDPAFTPVPTDEPEPPEPPPPAVTFTNEAWLIAVVTLSVLLGLFGYLIRPIIVSGLKAAGIFRSGLVVTGDGFIESMRQRARETAELGDDEAVEKFAREWESIKAEVNGTVSNLKAASRQSR